MKVNDEKEGFLLVSWHEPERNYQRQKTLHTLPVTSLHLHHLHHLPSSSARLTEIFFPLCLR